MKGINTYRHIAGKILRANNQPVTKSMLYKLSHYLDKRERNYHTGKDQIKGHATIDALIDTFTNGTEFAAFKKSLEKETY